METVSILNVTSENMCKKAPFFWLQVGDLDISIIFYKIQNFYRWPVLSVITHWTYTFLSPWALRLTKYNEVSRIPGRPRILQFFVILIYIPVNADQNF